MAVVYAVQNTLRPDGRPRFNYRPAERYGPIRFVLEPEASPFEEGIFERITHGMQEYEEDDYLLLVGNPTLIGLCAIAACHVRILQFLQWIPQARTYQCLMVDMEVDP